MKLYFQSGSHRLSIDTDAHTYCTNYSFLGGWKEYIRVSDMGRREILAAAIQDGYTEKDA